MVSIGGGEWWLAEVPERLAAKSEQHSVLITDEQPPHGRSRPATMVP